MREENASSRSDRVARRLVIATLNAAKSRELRALLGDIPYDLLSLPDVPGASLPPEGDRSYVENAIAKAAAAARLTSSVALADDSGLEVDALGGAPGVVSARFGGDGLTDAERCRYLLDRLSGTAPADRTARYRCVVAIVDGDQREVVEDTVEGVIAIEPRGSEGFGYDPIFWYPPLGCTFAEIAPHEKARVSHRARAMARAVELLRQE